MNSGVQKQREYKEGGVTGKGFKKGRSGNPGGRPRGSLSLTVELRRILADKSHDGRTRAELFMDAMLKVAAKGNGAAINQIWNRIDGPVKSEQDLSLAVTRVVIDI
jgi:hypothetical protein